ncbi:MAG TPA: hypothetical protein VM736_07755 [Gemmatimonadales bacterium]|nr:hypothetical protein [Gemmatimonadales bacterium]
MHVERRGATIAYARVQAMKELRFALLAAMLASCHFDKLFTTTGGGRAPPSGSSPILSFTTQPTSTTAGAPLPIIRVSAQDGAGNTVASFTGSVAVALVANPGAGTLAGTLTVSAVSGVATFSDLRIDKPASGYTISATAPGTGAATSGAFDILPAPATRLAFTMQPSNTVKDSTIRPAVQVSAVDSSGHVVTSFTGIVTVALGHDGSALRNARLSGSTAAAANAGVATFPNLSLDQLGSGYTLSAAIGSGPPLAASAPFDVTALSPAPAPATRVAFTTQPTNTTAGTALARVQVAALDSLGRPVQSFTGPVTIALGDNPGGATLAGGPQTVSAVNGVATFSGLVLDKAATGYTLTAAASGLAGDRSTPFAVGPGPASVLVFTVQPHNTLPLATIQPPVQVTAFDAFGNQASDFTGPVHVAIGHDGSLGGTATLSGTTTQPATSGVATFADLSIDLASVTYYTLTAAFGTGPAVVESATFTEP